MDRAVPPNRVVLHPTYGPALPELNWVPAPSYLMRRHRVLRLLRDMAPCRVLDIGCGPGALLRDFADRAFMVLDWIVRHRHWLWGTTSTQKMGRSRCTQHRATTGSALSVWSAHSRFSNISKMMSMRCASGANTYRPEDG